MIILCDHNSVKASAAIRGFPFDRKATSRVRNVLVVAALCTLGRTLDRSLKEGREEEGETFLRKVVVARFRLFAAPAGTD